MNHGEFKDIKPENFRYEYALSDDESIMLKKFKEEHKNCYKRFPCCSPFPGNYSIVQGTDGIGVSVVVVCNHCGEMQDITDYGCW